MLDEKAGLSRVANMLLQKWKFLNWMTPNNALFLDKNQ